MGRDAPAFGAVAAVAASTLLPSPRAVVPAATPLSAHARPARPYAAGSSKAHVGAAGPLGPRDGIGSLRLRDGGAASSRPPDSIPGRSAYGAAPGSYGPYGGVPGSRGPDGAASDSPEPPRRRRPWGPAAVLAPFVVGAVCLAAWSIAAWSGRLPRYLLPDPGQVGSKLLDGLFRRADFWPYIHTTFVEALGGCALGVTVALPLAVIIVHSRLVSAAITPYLGATQAIPAIALAPLLVLWVGYGLSGVVALIALMVFFPILVSAVTGLRHVDSAVLDAASLDGAGTWARLWHMELPLAGAAILAGVRNGFTLSVTGAVVGEMVMGGDGLGLLLTVQRDRSDPAGMIASIVVLAVIASTLYSLIALAERRLFVANRPRYR